MKNLTTGTLIVGAFYVLSRFFGEFGLEGVGEYQMWLVVLWAISPFILMLILNNKKVVSEKQRAAIFGAAIIVSVFGGYFYHFALQDYVGDKKGLIFVGVPLYQWIAIMVLVGFLIMFRQKSNEV